MMAMIGAVALAAGFSLGSVVAASEGTPATEPARLDLSVAPQAVAPGQPAQVTLKVVPARGIKINRYPRIRLRVPGVSGLVEPIEVSLGNPNPPHPDALESNYFGDPEPVRLELRLDRSAPAGRHEIGAEVKYFYCVAESGYCAPKTAEIRIPVTVR